MANSRLARLFMEVAPPQYISVMRHRTSKMLDTIAEEDRETTSSNDSAISFPKTSSASALSSSASPATAAAAASATIASANDNTKYFLMGVHRSLSMLNH